MAGIKYTESEENIVRLMYADYPASVIAKELNRTVESVKHKAQRLKLTKSFEFMRDINKKVSVESPNVFYITQTFHIYESKINFMV